MEDTSTPVLERSIQRSDFTLELNEEFNLIRRLCFSVYRTPPNQAVYLQLFHSLGDVGTCINGRTYLGNTPTMVAGPNTKMRFGVVAMGNEFHTFHIHGHRWTILGPHGNNAGTIQNSIEDTPVSQFEDTRPFGPANSFAFFIDEGNGFFRAQPAPIGEWHMHCHVLMHMDSGMMGSLLVVNGLEVAFPRFGHDDSSLPGGVPCMGPVMVGG
jgi:FtsP/CotA-like multicopper oxidase with cupredoxin domain